MKSLFIFSDSCAVGQFVSPHKTWVHLLSMQLEGKYLLQNASRNGETTRGALERLQPEVLRYQPDIVYVQFGSNDANKWQTDKGLSRVSISEFRANVRSIIERCQNYDAEVVLGNNHISYVKGIEKYNSAIADIAKNTGVTLIDHTTYPDGILMPDRIHLNECGHRLYFESVAQVIP